MSYRKEMIKEFASLGVNESFKITGEWLYELHKIRTYASSYGASTGKLFSIKKKRISIPYPSPAAYEYHCTRVA